MVGDRGRGTVTEGEEVVIFLDSEDDVTSVRTKLESVRGQKVALVIPPGAKAFQRGIAVKLLRRVAEGFSVDLSIVTASGDVQRLAVDEGVRVFSSIRAFRRYLEQSSTRPRKKSPANLDVASGVIVKVGALFGIVLIVAIFLFVAIPTQTVTLRPATEPIGETVEIRADPETRSVDYIARRVPARAIYDKVEGTDQVPVTGAGQGQEGRAEGRVTFRNRIGEEIAIPKGTIVVASGGAKFQVIQDVHLPPARGAYDKANVRAIDPGDKGIVRRLEISQVEGPLGQKVDVYNEEPTVGPGPGDLGIVTDSDQKRLHDQLYDRLSKSALDRLQQAVKSDETLPQATVKLSILDEVPDRRVGDQARALNLRMVVRVNGTAFDERDVHDLAARAWQPKLRPGFGIIPESVKILPAEVARVDGDVVVLRVRVDGVAAALPNEDQVVSAVRWRSARDAIDELARNFVLAEQPKIATSPSWAKRAFRIKVVLEH